MKPRIFKGILLSGIAIIISMSAAGLVFAGDHGWIMSVPKVIVEDQVYQVNIQRINGKNPMTAHEYRVDAGEATIRVSLVLEPRWAPDLTIAKNEIATQEFTMTIESGMTYQIGGKVDPHASNEAQRDGTFWQPVIHREDKR